MPSYRVLVARIRFQELGLDRFDVRSFLAILERFEVFRLFRIVLRVESFACDVHFENAPDEREMVLVRKVFRSRLFENLLDFSSDYGEVVRLGGGRRVFDDGLDFVRGLRDFFRACAFSELAFYEIVDDVHGCLGKGFLGRRDEFFLYALRVAYLKPRVDGRLGLREISAPSFGNRDESGRIVREPGLDLRDRVRNASRFVREGVFVRVCVRV